MGRTAAPSDLRVRTSFSRCRFSFLYRCLSFSPFLLFCVCKALGRGRASEWEELDIMINVGDRVVTVFYEWKSMISLPRCLNMLRHMVECLGDIPMVAHFSETCMAWEKMLITTFKKNVLYRIKKVHVHICRAMSTTLLTSWVQGIEPGPSRSPCTSSSQLYSHQPTPYTTASIRRYPAIL